jgi:RNA recognition motif-containing protein
LAQSNPHEERVSSSSHVRFMNDVIIVHSGSAARWIVHQGNLIDDLKPFSGTAL